MPGEERLEPWRVRTYRAFANRLDHSIQFNRRNQKVSDLLREVDVELARLSALYYSMLESFRDDAEQRCEALKRDQDAAMDEATNKEKYIALGPVKLSARELKNELVSINGDGVILEKFKESTISEVRETVRECYERIEETLKNLREYDNALADRYTAQIQDLDIEPRINALEAIGTVEELEEAVSGIYDLRYGFKGGDLQKLEQSINEDYRAERNLAPIRAEIDRAVNEVSYPAAIESLPVLREAIETVVAAKEAAEAQATSKLKYNALKKIRLNLLYPPEFQDFLQGVPNLLKGLEAAINKLPEANEQKAGFLERLAVLKGRRNELYEEADLAEFNKELAEIKAACNQLMTEVATAAGGGYNSEAYLEAIKVRFGVLFEIGEDSIFNLKKVYEMMALVPESHSVHNSLNVIKFESPDPEKAPEDLPVRAGYTSLGSKINIASFLDDTPMAYVDPNTKQEAQPNAFNICMLHEIGHSVDDKNKIMKEFMKHPGAGYGDWRKETVEDVLDIFKNAAMAELRAGGIAAGEGLEGAVSAVIDTALNSSNSESRKIILAQRDDGIDLCVKPEALEENQWTIVKKYVHKAYKVSNSQQWSLPKDQLKLEGNDRYYVNASHYGWHSYASSEREAITVRNYQWCSPSEWFAEVYAYCWMYNISRPNGVGPEMYHWLPPQAEAEAAPERVE